MYVHHKGCGVHDILIFMSKVKAVMAFNFLFVMIVTEIGNWPTVHETYAGQKITGHDSVCMYWPNDHLLLVSYMQH